MNLDFKEIVGIVLLIVSFGYLMLNPGQSMLDGLMKKRKKQYEQMLAEKAKQEDEVVELTASEDSTQI